MKLFYFDGFIFLSLTKPSFYQFLKIDEGIVHRLEEIRKRSNEALSSDDLSVALDGYMMAIKIAEKFPHNLKEEKAILYSNMAAVHLKKKEPKEALEAAQKSLRNDAGFVKASAEKDKKKKKCIKQTPQRP